uniref:Uncharacterized protein n=1 Tax=Fusarium oxysporum (strain Fo5176) TaxID=660025 RepID=A0A0D2XSZ5_FUSOF
MAALQIGGTLDTLAQGVGSDPQFEMPLDFSLGQVTTKTLPWDADDYLASEYLSNTSSTHGLSDLLQANYSMACQPSPNTDLNYACHKTSIESLNCDQHHASRRTVNVDPPFRALEHMLENAITSSKSSTAPDSSLSLKDFSRYYQRQIHAD